METPKRSWILRPALKSTLKPEAQGKATETTKHLPTRELELSLKKTASGLELEGFLDVLRPWRSMVFGS